MKLPHAAIGALLLSACSPEQVDLVVFGTDAGGALTPDAGMPFEGDLDASRERPSDAGTPVVDFDARVRMEAGIDGGRLCMSKSDCGPAQTCEPSACGSKTGVCVASSMFCNEKHEPECGCDGLTYYSPCLRRRYGVARDPECRMQRKCEAGPCAPHPATGELVYCSHYLEDRAMCRQQSSGERICYVLPQACPSYSEGDVYSWCDAPSSGTGGAGGGGGPEFNCISKCEAIKIPTQVPSSWGLVLPFAATQRERCMRSGPGGGVFPQP